MAVTFKGSSRRQLGKNLVEVWGTVTLDASNPTGIDLSGYGRTVLMGVVCLQATAAPGDLTSVVTCNPSTSTLNVYAWAPISGSDPTLVASTGTEEVAFMALVQR